MVSLGSLGLVAALLVLAACGDDAPPTAAPKDQGAQDDMGQGVDLGDMGPSDMSVAPDQAREDLDMSPPGDMAAPRRRYDPSLLELGPPATTCATPIADARGQAQPRAARVFAMSYRLEGDALRDHRSLREHLHALVHEAVLPCLSPDSPNVVLWPAAMSLPMMLLGPKAQAARAQADPAAAIAQLVPRLSGAVAHYKAAFPDVSLSQQLLLALTDTIARSVEDTYAQLARRYGLYMIVNVNLPELERSEDPALIAALGDPDYDDLTHVYVATSSTIQSRQLIFGPDGQLMDQRVRAYVTPAEREILALSPGRLDQLWPVQTPWGLVGVLDARQAWMPDVQDRLDDLGASHYLAPMALQDGWVQTPERDDGAWRPDVFMFGPWAQLMRSPRALTALSAQLTGRLVQIEFDGQVQLVSRAPDAQARFVGQDESSPASHLVGPWGFEDPGERAPTLTRHERRAALRLKARQLAQEPARYVRGAWAADLAAPDPQAVSQTHPVSASLSDGRVAVVSAQGPVGRRALVVEYYKDGQRLRRTPLQGVPEGAELIRPQVVATDRDELILVAEAVASDRSWNKLWIGRVDPARQDELQAQLLSTRSSWCYQPWLVRQGRRLILSWIGREGGLNRAVVMQGTLGTTGPLFANATPTAIDPSGALQSAAPGREPSAHQWAVRVAATQDRLAAVWLDYRHSRWEVMASMSLDGGISWTPALRVDETPPGVDALHESPTLLAVGDRFALAWVDKSAHVGRARLMTRSLGVESGVVTLGPALIVEDQGWPMRPWLASSPEGYPQLAYSRHHQGQWSLELITLDAALSTTKSRRSKPIPQGSPHFMSLLPGRQAPGLLYELASPQGSSVLRLHWSW